MTSPRVTESSASIERKGSLNKPMSNKGEPAILFVFICFYLPHLSH